jgi:hypothetical protein
MTAHAMRAHQEPPIPPLPGGDPDGEPGRQPPLPPGTPYPGRPQVDPPVGPPGEPGRPPPEIITGSLFQAERCA